MSIGRCAIALGCCLLLGAITTVGVGWTLALRSQAPYTYPGITVQYTLQPARGEGKGVLIVYGEPRLGAVFLWSWIIRVNGAGFDGRDAAETLTADVGVDRAIPWFHEPVWPTQAEERVEACGWPFMAMWCRIVPVQSDGHGAVVDADFEGGFKVDQLEVVRGIRFWGPGALPFRPIWSGFALNTAIYAAAWWLPFFVLSTARSALRRRRLKRGRCRRCGYDLAGLPSGAVCPECGAGGAT